MRSFSLPVSTVLSVLLLVQHGSLIYAKPAGGSRAIHPKLANLSKRQLDARSQVMASLTDVIRRDLESRDPDEYEVYYEHLLERQEFDYDADEETFTKRETSSGPGIRYCSDNKEGPAMTYDDGPYHWTKHLANVWANAGHKITYFINVQNWDCAYAAPYAERLQHAVSVGHIVGSHSATHPHFPQLSMDQVDEQIQIVETFAWDVLGVVPRLFRPPYGEITQEIYDHLQSRWGLKIIQWSVDAGDADGATPEQSINTILNANNNDIILNHETHDTSAHKVADDVIAGFAKKGIKSRSVKGCINQGNAYKVKLKNANRQRQPDWSCEARNVPQPGSS